MHELPIINSIIDICLQHAQKNGAKKIITIELKVGALSHLEPEVLQRYFDTFSKDTIAAGARLEIEETPVVYRCDGCANEYEVDLAAEKKSECPKCNGKKASLVSGNEYLISNIGVI